VLDLRGVGRGQPSEGIKLAEVFVPKGTLVAKLLGAHRPERLFSSDGVLHAWDRPIAVLTDNGTAGAGEIVAAALKDAGRGPVVESRRSAARPCSGSCRSTRAAFS